MNSSDHILPHADGNLCVFVPQFAKAIEKSRATNPGRQLL